MPPARQDLRDGRVYLAAHVAVGYTAGETVKRMQIERIVPLARQFLTIPIVEPRRDLWLW